MCGAHRAYDLITTLGALAKSLLAVCILATPLIVVTLCASRVHCELALKQEVIVYIQKGTETEQGTNLIILQQMFGIGRMTTIHDFLAKQLHVLCKT